MKKSNEEILARRIDESKKKKEEIVKTAVAEHKEAMPKKNTIHFKLERNSKIK
ncbi:hypothetical protein [Enterococcus mediterraneensis]|uniref:hypothetical protein n=1 Tax=Enterococcus mediterraneensis TaxID=2364791 RepID=UPI0013E0400E|nr:hypothetical protein [Enterococcus mediterraneensis]